jgi:hypothetical protein
MKLHMFRTVLLSIIRSFPLYTQQWCMSYRQLSSSRIRMNNLIVLFESCLQTRMTYTGILLCVQWKTPDNGQRNCPKHVELHSKNKFEKLVHLVGFVIQMREGTNKLIKDSIIHTYIVHTYVHTYIHMYVHKYICTYINTYVHTYICTYIHT